MSIMQGGMDITAQVMERVAVLQKEELKSSSVRDAAALLLQARRVLDNAPRPWQNDFIRSGVTKIDEILGEMRTAGLDI